jgi:TRAP-type mannitol/chloroaromatic compound transport system substrate-binding protein
MTRTGFIMATVLLLLVAQGARADQPAAVTAGAAPIQLSAATTVWRMQIIFDRRATLLGSLPALLAERVAAHSGNAMTLSIHDSGTLVPFDETVDAVVDGRLDAFYATPSFLGRRDVAFTVFAGLPFGPGPDELVRWARSAEAMALRDALERPHGVKSLVCGVTGPEGAGWFRRPINGPADLQGLRMRTFGLSYRVMQRLGVDVQLVSGADVFMAFDLGAIDAFEFSTPYLDMDKGFHRLSKIYYYPAWHERAKLFMLIVNRRAWDALAGPQRDAMQAACADTTDYALREDPRLQQAGLQAMRDRGVQVAPLPQTVVDAAERAWHQVLLAQAKKSPNFERVYRSLADFMR